MPITDYFLAPDDTTAATVISHHGPAQAGLPTVMSKNLDPVVTFGTLEALLTGRSYDEVVAAPRQGHAVSDTNDAESFVIAVTDTLRDALIAADPAQITETAARWAETEELAGSDPEGLADFIQEFATLARQAGDQHLYCFWAL